MKIPVVFKSSKTNDSTLHVHLQCISLLHYNPIYRKKGKNEDTVEDLRTLNIYEHELDNIDNTKDDVEIENVESFDVDFKCDIVSGVNGKQIVCSHRVDRDTDKNSKFCCIVDSGAEVSIICESVLMACKRMDSKLEIVPCSSKV